MAINGAEAFHQNIEVRRAGGIIAITGDILTLIVEVGKGNLPRRCQLFHLLPTILRIVPASLELMILAGILLGPGE